MFNILLGVISVFFTIYGLYYGITGLFAFFKRKEETISDKKKNKFSIIIAARNEEAVIGNLIDSLNKQNYPKDKYDINVIVNNSTDNTYKVSKKHGANTIKCEVPVKSKGEVLHYIFNKFKDKDNDAYVIFDADNIVHPDFLKHMNDSLNKGCFNILFQSCSELEKLPDLKNQLFLQNFLYFINHISFPIHFKEAEQSFIITISSGIFKSMSIN